MHVSVYTIDKKLFEGEADSLTIPGSDGELGILPMHIPLVSSLKEGSVVVRQGKHTERIEIKRGFVEVQPGSKVTILAS